MSAITRFSVSLDADLLAQFDQQIASEGCPTRSKAVADLIRQSLVREQWRGGDEVAAAIILVYDHHKRDLGNRLTHVQHDHHELIISSQHIHLDHHNCLETIIVRGRPAAVESLARQIKAVKGVKYAALAAASTGQDLQ